MQSSKVAYGQTPAYTGTAPEKPADARCIYAFAGWSPEVVKAAGDATYTATLNTLAEKAGVQDMEITELLASLDQSEDPALRTAIRNNGGGYYNHNLYFSTISPDGSREPKGELGKKIADTFGSFEEFKEKISALAVGQFGSGWAWLSVTPQ